MSHEKVSHHFHGSADPGELARRVMKTAPAEWQHPIFKCRECKGPMYGLTFDYVNRKTTVQPCGCLAPPTMRTVQ